MGEPIRSVLVAGGGIEGWLVALTLARRLAVRVTVVEEPGAAPKPSDLYAGTRPGFRRALAKLDIGEDVLVAQAGAVVRLGQLCRDWSPRRPPFLHCFGRYGIKVGEAPFHQAWLRADRDGEAAPLALHSTACVMAERGRVTRPADDEYSPLATFDYAFNLDPAQLAEVLRERALAAGVEAVVGRIATVDPAGPERIVALRLEDGRAFSADLFVDCTGPSARLLSAMPGCARESWQAWLAADRLLAADGPRTDADLPLVDTTIHLTEGFLLQAPLETRTLNLLAFEAGRASDGRAARLLRIGSGAEPVTPPVALPQGRQRRFWIGNCVALGDAAVTLEPLGAPNLHLLTMMIERLLRFMPDTDFDAVETREYDRKVALEADYVRDFVILHHVLAAGDEEKGVTPPPALAHALALFRARGKIPGREGDVAELDDWVAVLLGHGIGTEILDPFLDGVPRGEFLELSAAIRHVVADAVARAPDHRTFLAELSRSR